MKRFSSSERKLIFGMSMVSGLRTLGISMITPVFSYFAMHLAGASALSIGVAIGIFGFSQALFQIPMGLLSDKFGRKRIMVLGSVIFLLGIVLCGIARDVYFLAFSRFIAGAGAVTGVAMTWLTDGVNERARHEAVAYLGISIGLAVILGFPLSWVVTSTWDTSMVFFICAFTIMITIIVSLLFLEEKDMNDSFSGFNYAEIKNTLKYLTGNADLFRLSMAGFIGSVCLSGMFYIMPLLIVQEMHVSHMWKIFAPTAVIGTALMFYFCRKADRWGTVQVALIGFGLELIGVFIPMVIHSVGVLIISLVLFYSGHCILSPVLPVAVSRYPGQAVKGTVMCVFTTFQFLGLAIGGILSGYFLKSSSLYLFGFMTGITLCALMLMARYNEFRETTETKEMEIASHSYPRCIRAGIRKIMHIFVSERLNRLKNEDF